MAAGPERDHLDCPGVSGFKAWLFLSLPQIGSRSRLETPVFSRDLPPFRIYVCLRSETGLKSRIFSGPYFARFIQGITPSDRPPAPAASHSGKPARGHYILCAVHLSGGAAVVVGAHRRGASSGIR